MVENKINKEYIRQLLETVSDPEIPVLSVIDLGVVREIEVSDEMIYVVITPTYSGCPAMHAMEINIRKAIAPLGKKIHVTTVLSPAWTTDWMTEDGKKKLKEYGIAPPMDETDRETLFSESVAVPCPKCNSINTKSISRFGSTSCKAHYQCNDCKEPFDYFKCHR